MQDELADSLAAAYCHNPSTEASDQAKKKVYSHKLEASFIETDQQGCTKAQILQGLIENQTFEDDEIYPYPLHVRFTGTNK